MLHRTIAERTLWVGSQPTLSGTKVAWSVPPPSVKPRGAGPMSPAACCTEKSSVPATWPLICNDVFTSPVIPLVLPRAHDPAHAPAVRVGGRLRVHGAALRCERSAGPYARRLRTRDRGCAGLSRTVKRWDGARASQARCVGSGYAGYTVSGSKAALGRGSCTLVTAAGERRVS